jgi:hypothetical protein
MPDIQLDGVTARAALDVYYATVAQGALADTALQNPSAFATAAQGTLADTALQDASAFATAAQGATADSALQTVAVPSDLTATGVPSVATFLRGDGVWAAAGTGPGGGDLLATNNLSDVADAAVSLANLGGATAAQGALADTALQNAAAFATSAQGALADTALQDASAFATAAQGALADTSLQDAAAFATAAQGALADAAATLVDNTFTGTQTLSGSSSTVGLELSNAAETTTVVATVPPATITIDVSAQSIVLYTVDATAIWATNLRFSAGTPMNDALSVGQSLSVTVMASMGATGYLGTALQVDGVSVTPLWQGGIPTAAGTSGTDVYTFTITKIAASTYRAIATMASFE